MFYYYIPCPDEGAFVYRSVKAHGCPMPDTYLNGRPVYFGDEERSTTGEPYLSSAYYCDTDDDLNDIDLDALNDQEEERLLERARYRQYG